MNWSFTISKPNFSPGSTILDTTLLGYSKVLVLFHYGHYGLHFYKIPQESHPNELMVALYYASFMLWQHRI